MVLEEFGFEILEKSISNTTVINLRENLSGLPVAEGKSDNYGVRDLLNISPKVKEFAQSKDVRNIIEEFLGKDAKIVRAIYFDKTPSANWKVPWHQDITISVAQNIETTGFTAWTLKANIQHVQPPIEILERMLTLRFHIDDTDETNGALKVLPKTHKLGRLDATEIQYLKSKQTAELCKVKKGDCLLMKPLLLHSSSAGLNPTNRRVIHFECSAENLPNGLNWYGS